MRNIKIAQKLGLSFLFISIFPLVIVAILAYNNAKAAMTEQVIAGLLATSESAAHQIENYFLERKRDVTTLSMDPTLIDAAEKLNQAFLNGGLDTLNYRAMDQQVRPFLTYFRDTTGFHDLFLISPAGDAFFSVNQGEDLGSNYKTGRYKDSELAHVFDRANTLLETEISDFGYYQATNEPAAFVAAPIIKQGEVVGVVALQMSNQEVYRLVQDYTGLRQTGEIVIGSRVREKATFITPVRHDPHAAFRRQIAMGSDTDKPLQKAVQAKRGAGIAIDYRGQEVLAAWRYLPTPRWGIVVKMDTAEAFASIDRLRNLSAAIAGTVLLVVVFAAGFISKSISDPIVKLKQITEAFTRGDLRQRVKSVSSDEVGELAGSFNTMADRIDKNTSELLFANAELKTIQGDLERRVRERTAELESTNQHLEAFTYSVAHDLRSPLRGIDGLSKILIEDYATVLDAKGADYLNRVRKAAKKMDQIITALLSLTKITRTALCYHPVSLSSLASELAEELRKEYSGRAVEVIIAKELYAECDPDLLRVLLANLLDNAFKFSSKVAQARIEFGLRHEADQAIFLSPTTAWGFPWNTVKKSLPLSKGCTSKPIFPEQGLVWQPCNGLCIVMGAKYGQRHKRMAGQRFFGPCL